MKTYRVKKEGYYPWPCANGSNNDRTIMLFKDDQLTRYKGKFMKHTGICCFNINLKEDEIEVWKNPPKLVLM